MKLYCIFDPYTIIPNVTILSRVECLSSAVFRHLHTWACSFILNLYSAEKQLHPSLSHPSTLPHFSPQSAGLGFETERHKSTSHHDALLFGQIQFIYLFGYLANNDGHYVSYHPHVTGSGLLLSFNSFDVIAF